jgi:hypothetical protein
MCLQRIHDPHAKLQIVRDTESSAGVYPVRDKLPGASTYQNRTTLQAEHDIAYNCPARLWALLLHLNF